MSDFLVFDSKAAGQFLGNGQSFSLVSGEYQSNKNDIYNIDNPALHAWGMVLRFGLDDLMRLSPMQKQRCYSIMLGITLGKMREKNTRTGVRYPYKYNFTKGVSELSYGNGAIDMQCLGHRGELSLIQVGNKQYAIDIAGNVVATRKV